MSSLLPTLTKAKTPTTDSEWTDLGYQAASLFTPHSPISEQELFAGRFELIDRLTEVVFQEGQHAVLYGERGVGKSSLANILKDKLFAPMARFNVVKRNCTITHDFKLIWKHIFSDYTYNGVAADDWIDQHHNPFDIYQLIDGFSSDRRPIFIIDEFDRVADADTKVLMADTIKYLSDYGSKATIIIVGVSTTVADLFAGHESITRNVAQILVPRMDPDEIKQLIESRLTILGMTATGPAMQFLISLAQGLPGYAHLMAQAASRNAIRRRSLEIDLEDLSAAINYAVENSDETIKAAYADAIRSTKPKNQYKQALLACALALADNRGFFNRAAVRGPFSAIMKRKMEIPAFARHLNEFCDPDRGPALIKEGKTQSFEYRFAEPLLRPYVVIRGIAEGLLNREQITSLRSQVSSSTND